MADAAGLIDRMRSAWEALGVRGRVYVATEGVNAQVGLDSLRLAAWLWLVLSTPKLLNAKAAQPGSSCLQPL